jgi:tripartite-type tricarboxylate transporter receptor subunit TctC
MAACLACGPGSAIAADWKPTKPVEIIVPAGTGGSIDRFARVLQKIMQTEKLVSQPVVVVNKNGAAGGIAWNYVIQQKGDPHYLIISSPNLITSALMEVNSVAVDATTPIVVLSTEYHSTIVRTDSPIKSGNDLLQKMRAEPGSLKIGVAPGLGVGSHVALSLMLAEAKIDQKKTKVVVFNSSGESVTAVLGGHVDFASVGTSNALQMVQAGKVRILGMTSPKRLAEVAAPTWKELGVDAVFPSWRGVAAPPNLTNDQVQYWERVFARVVQTQEWKDELSKTQYDPLYFDSVQSRAFIDSEYKKLHSALKEAGLVKTRQPNK